MAQAPAVTAAADRSARRSNALSACPRESRGSLVLPLARSLIVAWPQPHFAAICGWLKPRAISFAMVNLKSMPEDYRNTDYFASDIPILDWNNLAPMSRSDFGARLHASRKLAKLTQAKLAARAGLSQSNIAELEKSGNGSSATTALARATGVNAEWLSDGTGEMLSTGAPQEASHRASSPDVLGALEILGEAIDSMTDPESKRAAIETLKTFVSNPGACAGLMRPISQWLAGEIPAVEQARRTGTR